MNQIFFVFSIFPGFSDCPFILHGCSGLDWRTRDSRCMLPRQREVPVALNSVKSRVSSADVVCLACVLALRLELHAEFALGRAAGATSRQTTYCSTCVYVCVFFTLNRYFYPSTSSTPSVRADSSNPRETHVLWSQTTTQRPSIVYYEFPI